MTKSTDKLALRLHMRAKAQHLSKQEVNKSAHAIQPAIDTLLSNKQPKNIHAYRAMAIWLELPILQTVERYASSNQDIHLSVAQTTYKQEVQKAAYDMIFVPMMAFDKHGNRLGRGKGWYDRLLAENPGALAVGIAYDWNEVEVVPTEPHDQKLDLILTPTRIIVA